MTINQTVIDDAKVYAEAHLRPGGPCTTMGIAHFLYRQQPGVTDRRTANEIADRAVRQMLAEGKIVAYDAISWDWNYSKKPQPSN